ncbi:MAG: response regulator transcription factor [Gammaproteobacteria bacterium]|nr:response regulator transcription factor [Gammaproteobacteria bacterium]
MTTKPHILVVEDEPAIRTGLVDVLTFHGYDVTSAEDGISGLEHAVTGRFDLILLDIMLPGMNGFDVCNAIREIDKEQPIIILTAKVSDEDIVRGLRLGADDYVAKPFSVEQLVLRIAAVIRRTQTPEVEEIVLTAKGHMDVVIDTRNLNGKRGNETIHFTRREMGIIAYLNAHGKRPVSRDELLTEVWGYAKNLDIETRTVDIHIAKLRRKLEPDSKNPVHLITVRGAGYRLLGR